MTDGLHCRSNLFVEVVDLETGEITRQETHNAVVAAGRNLIRDLLNGSGDSLSHMALGTDDTAVADGDTALGTEVVRGAFTSVAATASTLTIKYYLDGSTGNSNTLTEAGLFNAASDGTMYARAILASSIAKTSSKAVTLTWEIAWATA